MYKTYYYTIKCVADMSTNGEGGQPMSANKVGAECSET